MQRDLVRPWVGGVPWEESVHAHKGHGELGVGWQEKIELKAKVHIERTYIVGAVEGSQVTPPQRVWVRQAAQGAWGWEKIPSRERQVDQVA